MNKPKESKPSEKNELSKKTAKPESDVIENKKDLQQNAPKNSDDKDSLTQDIKEVSDDKQ